LLLCAVVVAGCGGSMTTTEPDHATTPSPSLHPRLTASMGLALRDTSTIPAERRDALQQIADHVRSRTDAGETARLLFICTHNSRRSHMGQLWAAAAAAYFGITGVETYSGGTEATAFNPRAVAALRRAGFGLERADEGSTTDNPRYSVSLGGGLPAQVAFSKRYEDPPNPAEGFVAVMTCSDADRACPFVRGADLRIALPYVDPKASDGTADEAQVYDERSRQIATEMAFLFSRVDAEVR
jgi:protein-tyrosine-phosphatase